MPAGEMQGIHEFEELLRQSVEKHLLGQSAADAAGRKRRRDGNVDGETTAPAAKRTKVNGDGESLTATAKYTEGDSDGKCPAPAVKRKRAARHNVAYKRELSPVVLYNTGKIRKLQ
jgi:hypothetical protein